jgi:hypothetical protein
MGESNHATATSNDQHPVEIIAYRLRTASEIRNYLRKAFIADYRCMYGNQNRFAARSEPLTTGGRNSCGAGAANGYHEERQA